MWPPPRAVYGADSTVRGKHSIVELVVLKICKMYCNKWYEKLSG